MHWDVYCRVVDNFGDIGVAWRLASDLAARGESVRLVADDRSALTWMAPSSAPGVEVVGWEEEDSSSPDVVVETFGCGLPESARERAAARPATVCINLEHLSAEAYAERCHGLPSPRPTASGEAATTWFFYPGFTTRTGGLLREPELADAWRQPAGKRLRDLRSLGVDASAGERVVSLFCYRNEALPAMLDSLASAPTLLVLAPGPATEQVREQLGPTLRQGLLRAVALPFLSQPAFDRLLASCDINCVRGEDSLVRAIWAGAPFVWQLYPQADGAHMPKLAAFLDRFLSDAPERLRASVRDLFEAWNGGGAMPPWPPAPEWGRHCRRWRDELAAEPDLATQLVAFARARR